MVALCRHQLVHLNAAGWAAVQQRPWDDEARACLAHWAAQRLPLVVTQQRDGVSDDWIALGLPAPLQWQRRRLALQVTMRGVLYFDEFPRAAEVTGLLPPRVRGAWQTLLKMLAALGVVPRVYGSFGWQRLTRLTYLHADSDLDLRLPVDDAAMADAVTAALHAAPFAMPRLDGEIVFPDDSAVAWREWRLWRERRADRVLVKRLRGVAMERGDAWLVEHQPC
jgi:phosphoribosyl-dephospho-CoA transferase